MFDPDSIATLKHQANVNTSNRGPTRMEATTALIWKVAAKASSSIRPFSPQSPHALLSYVNIRTRASPPLSYESIGNLILTATGICFPENQPGLSNLMGEIRESIARINSNHIDSFKGEIVQGAFDDILKRLKDLMDITEEGDRCLNVTSLLNSGIYNTDFGWGMPVWFYHMNPGGRRLVSLNDTLKSGGVEATITLSSEEMEIFKNHEELLTYATVNPTITYK
ncbi:putative vinorine synthase [Helianthus debilis subsp. tardiflorus]